MEAWHLEYKKVSAGRASRLFVTARQLSKFLGSL
jgi:hypothetical protein